MTTVEPRADTPAPGAPQPAPATSADPATGTGPGAWTVRIAVTAVVAAGVLLRLWSTSPLWLDEAISADIAAQPVGGLLDALRHDGHPPLYYLLLKGWMAVFGSGDAAVRLLSGVASIATLPLVWALGHRLGGRRVASIAVVLAASSPFAVRYATETRMYALVGLWSLGLCLAVFRALDRPTPARLAPVGLLAAASVWTHYWGLWLVGAWLLALVVLARRQRTGRGEAVRVGGALAVGGATFVFWLDALRYQAAHTGTPWAKAVEPMDALFDLLVDLGGGGWIVGRLLGPILAVAVLLAATATARGHGVFEVDLRTIPGARTELGVAGLTLLLGLLAAMATSAAFQPRYAAGLIPLLLLVAAVGLGRLPAGRSTLVLLTVVALLGLASGVRADVRARTQAREVAAALRAGAAPGEAVGFCPDQLRPGVQRELDKQDATFPTLTFPGGSPDGRVDWVDYRERIVGTEPAAFVAELEALGAEGGAVWLVAAPRYRGFGDRCNEIERLLGLRHGAATRVVAIDTGAYERFELLRFGPP